ncbi:glucan endo-1,3-beta-D-glucosidase [Lineolata rhizophorae]|uniref:Glucan endo-1,3-beta-D-glucosidase n=1 Tax=Lineolata rhizophorae TaxID=578093 RepID=A0A6A6NS71_9PEZI|nr:glucan endo-1,3-beta-D-glucosidase [Lineolata rhizophorae]
MLSTQQRTTTSTATTTPVRPSTPESEVVTPAPRINPFATPYGSIPGSKTGSSTGLAVPQERYFRSRRVKKGTVERPWLNKKDPKEKWVTIIPILGILIGLGISAFLIWDGLQTVVVHEYCPVLDEDFSSGLDSSIWTKEVEVGGFGNGQFEMTTDTDENAFIKDGALHIKPTLQNSDWIEHNKVINLLEDGTCTSSLAQNCITGTNTTNGTIVNPVKSARLNTKTGASIKYGRVEVTARMPDGDWLWPAIWMLPVDAKYGQWPKSGEIDIAESRGNDYSHPQGGNNIVSSTIHWGPDSANDAWWRNNVKRQALHTTYAKGFHTFGLEWSEKYMFTYVDTRLLQVMYVNFDRPFWEKGQFPLSDSNGTRLVDPWSQTGRHATPFDQDFYLILNVAVGGTNGWFKDGKSGKPWVDGSPSAKRDFWNARDEWFPTWGGNAEMIVKSVKMWQQKGYNGC